MAHVTAAYAYTPRQGTCEEQVQVGSGHGRPVCGHVSVRVAYRKLELHAGLLDILPACKLIGNVMTPRNARTGR